MRTNYFHIANKTSRFQAKIVLFKTFLNRIAILNKKSVKIIRRNLSIPQGGAGIRIQFSFVSFITVLNVNATLKHKVLTIISK
jgi:hypothetical protein